MNSPEFTPPEPIEATHNLTDFDSGEPSLDEWLRKRATGNSASGASRCFVVCEGGTVVGYYSLSAGAVAHEAAPKNMRRDMPDPLPVVLLGRLAIDRKYQNRSLGKALLRDAMIRTLMVAADTGVFAILVHAISEPARRFYLSAGFVPSPLQPMTLLTTLETARAILLEKA